MVWDVEIAPVKGSKRVSWIKAELTSVEKHMKVIAQRTCTLKKNSS